MWHRMNETCYFAYLILNWVISWMRFAKSIACLCILFSIRIQSLIEQRMFFFTLIRIVRVFLTNSVSCIRHFLHCQQFNSLSVYTLFLPLSSKYFSNNLLARWFECCSTIDISAMLTRQRSTNSKRYITIETILKKTCNDLRD